MYRNRNTQGWFYETETYYCNVIIVLFINNIINLFVLLYFDFRYTILQKGRTIF